MFFARRTIAPGAVWRMTVAHAVRAAGAAAMALGLELSVATTHAVAQEAATGVLQIPLHKASIVKLSGAANNVIIGNPSVADVTVENPTTLVLFGRGPGETNILVLNSAQKEILSASIVVSPDKDRQVSVLAPSTGKSAGMIEILYACADRCVRFPADLTKLGTQTGSGGSDKAGLVGLGSGGRAGQAAPAPAAQAQGGSQSGSQGGNGATYR